MPAPHTLTAICGHGCPAGTMWTLLLAATSQQMSKDGFCLGFFFPVLVFWRIIFKVLRDLMPKISLAKVKIFDGSKKQDMSREI